MDRNKAIGYALILIGLVFGFEGTAFTYLGFLGLNEVNQAIALSSVFETTPEMLGVVGFYQSLQVFFMGMIGYSLLKTVAGVACMLFGYGAVKGKK